MRGLFLLPLFFILSIHCAEEVLFATKTRDQTDFQAIKRELEKKIKAELSNENTEIKKAVDDLKKIVQELMTKIHDYDENAYCAQTFCEEINGRISEEQTLRKNNEKDIKEWMHGNDTALEEWMHGNDTALEGEIAAEKEAREKFDQEIGATANMKCKDESECAGDAICYAGSCNLIPECLTYMDCYGYSDCILGFCYYKETHRYCDGNIIGGEYPSFSWAAYDCNAIRSCGCVHKYADKYYIFDSYSTHASSFDTWRKI